MKKVSIIIPVYNAQMHIRKCLDSILSQTYKNIEIVALNDGSKDSSFNILKEYDDKYDNFIIVDKKNEGIAKTRNKGIDLATGDYIMFIDNDDYIDNNYVETYVNNISGYDIVMGGYKRINEKNELLFKQDLKQSEWAKYIITAPWAKMYDANFIKKNKIKFLDYIGEDLYFNFNCFNNNARIKIIDNNGYVWFYNTQSFSNKNRSKGAKSNLDIVKLFNYLKEVCDFDNPYVQYFYKRYEVWYMFFESENSSYKELEKEYKILDSYLRENNIKTRIFPLSRKLNGETLKNRIAVLSFITFEKLGLIKLFLKIIAKN